MPAAPCTRGSTTTAATWPGWAVRSLIHLLHTGHGAGGGFEVQGASVTVRGRGSEHREQQGLEHGVEPGDAAQADVSEGVAVIGVFEGDEAVAGRLGIGLLAPVLEGHLERDLDGGGAVVGEEDAGEAGWGEVREAAGQFDGGGVGDSEERDVGHLVELAADGLVDAGVAMAVDVAPEGADAIEVAAAVGVEEVDALAAFDDQGVGRQPVGLGREGVPEVGPVPGAEGLDVDLGHGPQFRTARGVAVEVRARSRRRIQTVVPEPARSDLGGIAVDLGDFEPAGASDQGDQGADGRSP